MAGASLAHNLIAGNTLASLHSQLRGKPCTIYPSDMRLKVSRTGLYTYPDISIVCGEPQLEDKYGDTLLNPIILIEVLSPSTETYDRGKKFQHYRTLASLREYILIAQDSYRVEHYIRQSHEAMGEITDQWLLSDVIGIESRLPLPAIVCSLTLADIYEKVTLTQPD
jgi:Uma2 family endonuclease